ncbi:unnamed protein product [Aphanomyces euteiches]
MDSSAKELQENKKKKVTSFVDDRVRFANNFREVGRFLEANYPHLIGRIEGQYHLPPLWKQQLSQLIGYVQMMGFALLLFGEYLLPAFNLPPDFWLLTQMRENKLLAFGFLMVLGTVSQSMMTTGAFEVYFNGASSGLLKDQRKSMADYAGVE